MKQPPHRDLRSLFQQFATETYYILSNLRNLSEANQRREEMIMFVNQFNHRIRNTLQGILDNATLLRMSFQGIRPRHPDEIEALVYELMDDSTVAADIVDLFTWSVRLSGQGSLRPQLSFSTVEIAEIISESVRKLKRSASRRQISLKNAQLKSEVYIEGDPHALTEIFDNLIENAIKFANDGTSVAVDAIDSRAVKVPSWSLGAAGWRITLSNQGLGLAPDELEEVFKPLKQGRTRPPYRVIPGTGLGLAICRQIVSEHGGRIWIASKPAPKAANPGDLHDCLVVVYLDLPNKPPLLPALVTGGS